MITTETKNLTSISSYLTLKRKIVDRRLEEIIRNEPQSSQLKKLVDSMRYTLLGNGKRIRPILTIAIYELFSNNIDEIVDPACAIELIHSASLMLDDLPCMDDATMRRGKMANHHVFGEATTILASAALWVSAFKIFSKIESVEINSIVKETADSIGNSGLIRGQFLDIESFKKPRTIKELNACYYLKTGILFENAAKIGALVGKASKEEERSLAKFGRDFGLAFQIRDDIFDATSTLSKEGKDVRIDNKNEKPTYVSLLGLEKAKKVLSLLIEKIIEDIQKLNLNVEKLIGLTKYLKVN